MMWKAGRRRIRRVAPLVLAAGLTAAMLVAPSTLPAAAASAPADATDGGPPFLAGDWSSWSRDLNGTRFAANETAVTPNTVGQLTVKWAYTFPRIQGVFPGSQPAIVNGVLYVGSPDAKLLALDAVTGATRWSFDLTTVSGPWTPASPNPVRDGPAVFGGTVYFGDSRGYLYAVNQFTGQLRWATHLDTVNPDVQITGSPVVYGGRVFVGVSNKEAGYQNFNLNYPCCTARGQVVALNASTGEVIWRHYTVPAAQPVGTWPSGATMYAPSGVSVWSTPAIDPVSRTLFVGTGQNYTGATSEADNVVALSIDTGAVRWQHQTQPDTYTSICDNPPDPGYCPGAATGTAHDWDFSASPNLFPVGGRTVVGIGDKAGVYRAFDAETGQLLWTQHLSPNPSAPGGSAGIMWGTSYDGHSLYAATWFAGPGTLSALDPATGAVRWQTPSPATGCSTGGAAGQPGCAPAFTPAVTTSPGLVFEGNADGKFYVFSAATGALLWQYDTVQEFAGVNGQPGHGESVSGLGGAVVANGMVYVQSGYYPLFTSQEGTVLIAFGLPGG
jgi:polyvinyl alcohol dehydrogenase (cytochrome)